MRVSLKGPLFTPTRGEPAAGQILEVGTHTLR